MMLLVRTKIPVADDYVPSQSRRNKRRAYPEKKDEIFVHYFLYIPRGILLLIQGNVAHSGSFLLQTKWSETRNQSLSIFIVAPMMPLKQMWIKEKTTTCLMTGTVMMKIFCMSCRTLSLTNTELLSSETEWLSTCKRVWETYLGLRAITYLYLVRCLFITLHILRWNILFILCHYWTKMC